MAIAQDRDLRGAPTAVFLLVLGSVALEGFHLCVQQDFANKLSMDKSTISRAFNLLCKKGILKKSDDKFGPCHMYSVNLPLGKKLTLEELNRNQKNRLKFIKGGKKDSLSPNPTR